MLHFASSTWKAPALATAALLAAGSGAPQSLAGTTTGVGALSLPLSGAKAVLYVGQSGAPLDEFPADDKRNRGPLCSISSVNSVYGIGVDSAGMLWAPQDNASGSGGVVYSFAPNCGAEGLTLQDSHGVPAGIGFGSDGTHYVLELVSSSGAGDVAVYPPGAMQPSRYLTNSHITNYVTAMGLDSKGNVFVLYEDQSGLAGHVLEFVRGKGSGRLRPPLVGVTSGTLTFDAADDMIIVDTGSTSADIFAPPYRRMSGAIALRGTSWQCALNADDTRLACAELTGPVDIYTYPAGTYLFSISAGLGHSGARSWGVAFSPSPPEGTHRLTSGGLGAE